MNNIYYYIQTLNVKIDKMLRRKMDEAAYTKFKTEHGKELSTAEIFNILRDLDKVMHGEMKLSEYVDKRGTVYLDEKIQPLFVKERQKQEPERSHGLIDRRYRIKMDQKTNLSNVPGENYNKSFTIDELREIALKNSKKRSSIPIWSIILVVILLIGVGLFLIGEGIAVTQQHTQKEVNSLYDKSAVTPQKGNVFVCTSETSTKYHNDLRCQGLKACSAEIEEVGMTEAVDMGYEKCGWCYKETNKR